MLSLGEGSFSSVKIRGSFHSNNLLRGIIACKVKEHLHRYKEDQRMYENCDIVVEMIDGGSWEIFSKNTPWIDRLAKKYNQVEFLKPDFQGSKNTEETK